MPKEKKSTQPKKSYKRVTRTSPPVEDYVAEEMSEDETPATKTLKQVSQQVNMLLILGIALFLFNMYLFWKIKKIEGNVAGATTAAAQQGGQQQQVKVTEDQIKKLFSKDYISFGDANRKNLFVEFTDPSCPYCHLAGGEDLELNQQAGAQFQTKDQGGSYVPPVKEIRKLVEEGKASLAILYRNGHGAGEMATKALYCAHDNGKFWEAHDLLMSNAGYTLLNTTLEKSGGQSPADNDANQQLMADFLAPAIDSSIVKDCLASKKYDAKIARDTKVGDEMGVGGTPGFFVNTTAFPGAYSYPEMASAVKS